MRSFFFYLGLIFQFRISGSYFGITGGGGGGRYFRMVFFSHCSSLGEELFQGCGGGDLFGDSRCDLSYLDDGSDGGRTIGSGFFLNLGLRI